MVLTEKQKELRRARSKRYNESEKGRAKRKAHVQSGKKKFNDRKYQQSEHGRELIKSRARTNLKIHWYKTIVSGSKNNDKLFKRTWNEEDYITPEFVKFLNQQQESKCIYCQVEMQYGEDANRKSRDGLTIQRKDNSIAHIQSNCVLCCMRCNNVYQRKSHQEILDFLNS